MVYSFHFSPKNVFYCRYSSYISQGLSHKDFAVRCASVFMRKKMFLSKAVVAAFLLMAMLEEITAMPQPGVLHERHVIHAPIKFKIIHHYKVIKVPKIIKKHLHYFKSQDEYLHESKPTAQENHPNQIFQDDDNGRYNTFEFQSQEYHPKLKISGISFQHSLRDSQEEDYEEPEQSQEEEYEDYELE